MLLDLPAPAPFAKSKAVCLGVSSELVLPLLGPKAVLTWTCHTSSKFSHFITLRNLTWKTKQTNIQHDVAVPLQSARNESLHLVVVAKVTCNSWQNDGDKMSNHIRIENILEDVYGKKR